MVEKKTESVECSENISSRVLDVRWVIIEKKHILSYRPSARSSRSSIEARIARRIDGHTSLHFTQQSNLKRHASLCSKSSEVLPLTFHDVVVNTSQQEKIPSGPPGRYCPITCNTPESSRTHTPAGVMECESADCRNDEPLLKKISTSSPPSATSHMDTPSCTASAQPLQSFRLGAVKA